MQLRLLIPRLFDATRPTGTQVKCMKKPKLLIIDDDRMLAELLSGLLVRELPASVVGLANSGTEALALAGQHLPDLVVLDIEMPDQSGLDLIEPLRELVPESKIVMLSSHFDPFTVYRVLRSRVQGYVEKPSPVSALVSALKQVLRGQTFFSPVFISVKQQCLEAADAFHKILSEREQMVLRFMVAGQSDVEIGQRCEISPETVIVHRKHMRSKLGVHTDRELLSYARRWGLSAPGKLKT